MEKKCLDRLLSYKEQLYQRIEKFEKSNYGKATINGKEVVIDIRNPIYDYMIIAYKDTLETLIEHFPELQ